MKLEKAQEKYFNYKYSIKVKNSSSVNNPFPILHMELVNA